MTATTPLLTLLKGSFRSWISAKGFWLVVVAALLPVALTGAWVASHTADLAATELRIEGGPFEAGDPVRVVSVVKNVGSGTVGPFNVSISVGDVYVDSITQTAQYRPRNTPYVESLTLAPGESREVVLEWNATTNPSGTPLAVVEVDPNDIRKEGVVKDAVLEKEENNNLRFQYFAVNFATPTTPPNTPPGLGGSPTATSSVDLEVTDVTKLADVKQGDNVTLRATITNKGTEPAEAANVTLRVAQTSQFGATALVDNRTNVTLGPGESQVVELAWTAAPGAYFVEAWATPPSGLAEQSPPDNHAYEPFTVNPVITSELDQPPPPEKQMIKEFSQGLMGGLYLRLVLPFIALFYAAGVIADERERGALVYILTRPLSRWLIPITKFVGSFLVASIAAVIGVAITYVLLFGATTQGKDIGYLVTPLLASLLTLFAYGALFTLMGTIFDRPYLAGLLFVLGWETVATIAGVFQLAGWVKNLTLTHHIQQALAGWPFGEGIQWLPAGDDAVRGLLIVLAIGVVALATSAVWMHKREFEVG